MSIKLEAKTREKGGVNQLRQAGFVPGVVYGRGVKSTNIAVARTLLEQALKTVGENTLLELEIGGGKSKHVLIHDLQRDPVKELLSHVDFLEVRLDQKIKADIPLVFIGESPAVKELAGVLVRSIQYIEVEALPQNLPHNIEVDISHLKTFEDRIAVADIKVGLDVKVFSKPEAVVASVVPPRSEAELEALKTEVVEDVSKVEGVVKPETSAEGGAESKGGKEKETESKKE
ncbi:MAG: 50S ribosomal protein L25 [Candidatus Sungbacteria bacterium]|uniref:Large ribosomal subunit protein bL25 n=1 Tax=Candidatus Sungiibacteriota bacterium TaxID=2750080 RepID=A0A9D6DNH2_9BACT|nr:50S ribosomal protein L25 [Candidatus Sungbacteria bacterium]